MWYCKTCNIALPPRPEVRGIPRGFDEMENRVKQYEAHNARQWKEHNAKIENSNRMKELKRLFNDISVEQLQSINRSDIQRILMEQTQS